jgi:aminopeptidase N
VKIQSTRQKFSIRTRGWSGVLCFALLVLAQFTVRSVEAQSAATVDVLHYNITVEPDISNKTLKGSVTIRFRSQTNALSSVDFDCGDLEIDSVKQSGVNREFSVKNHRIRVTIPPLKNWQTTELELTYHGAPKRGIRFFPDSSQVYTVFSTSQWTVCVDAPADRATLKLTLLTPTNLIPLSNGRLVSKRQVGNKTSSMWEQLSPIPTYVFGFAVGPYHELTDKKGEVELRYLVTSFTDDQARQIFRDTPDMLAFYEKTAGVKYADKTYSQVLAAGGVEQEMSSFTAMNEAYGKRVLANEQDLWLGAHEFAHQWWGNMVTCRDWNHFWLNEGIATFMASAYLEHRFGKAVYLREIDRYRASYERVRDAGKDKSLVFPDWLRPTREDRILVYDKGAYVMHLLREQMGEQRFWNGMRLFTRRHWGKSVVTADFEATMEEANGSKLDQFFAKWVYLKQD